jgi:hypothetical protein
MLTERLRRLVEQIANVQREVARELQAAEDDLRFAKDAWPDGQVVAGADWQSRDVVPNFNGIVWASDGKGVWIIHAEAGRPIGGSPSVVRYWTRAFIPAPPADPRTAR